MTDKLTDKEMAILREMVSWTMMAEKENFMRRPSVSKRQVYALGRKLGVKAQEYVDDR